ncbi:MULTISPECIES: MurR/RpiR family transcriptional regulator [Bacillus]|uniref:MurR/RpiR family transcriptional regulator n=1 Tax=Bacillus TaxID=1386 RepID=UPI0002A11E9A|nr:MULTISPECIES: MurR/RpiR family transcriptional regulator [Bacillus]MBL3614566.1 MurR/RpiR family transcriptional regulator [Bacillus sp. RHFS18]AFZ92229.1 RpiR family transcriptional regulator [Bacillus velezensis AS43.3]ARJ76499.1 MurR/RpiR family transcriptional regulator [Bacillus velezensis]ATX84845.1 MurR/RpiR family transcriptional regulator [Bacillus velezensis]AZJ42991.1 MurR/RpiR family transcriptional regulator [Bacillus velezensis]
MTPVNSSSIGKIQAASKGLSPKLRAIADHIVKEPKDVIHLSIIQLAEKTKSSEATIFRLCKRLGFSGYQDLKIALAQEIVQEPVQHIHEEMSPDDDIEVIIRKVFRTNISGLTDTFHLLDPADVEKAVEMIHRADRIEFYGNGGSGLIATDAYHKFMRTGINCIAHTDSHFQAMSAGLLGPESAVIGISHSGSNKDVLDAVKTAKSLGAGTIGITSYQKSPLTQISDVVLYTSTRETAFRTEAMSARLAQLSVIDTLYFATARLRQEKTLANLQQIRKMIAHKRL